MYRVDSEEFEDFWPGVIIMFWLWSMMYICIIHEASDAAVRSEKQSNAAGLLVIVSTTAGHLGSSVFAPRIYFGDRD